MEAKDLNISVPEEQIDAVENVDTTLKTEEGVTPEEKKEDITPEPEEVVASDGANETESAEDYSGKGKAELVDILRRILNDKPVQTIKRDVEAVKIAFYKEHRQQVEQLKKEFVATGSPEEEFSAPLDKDEENIKVLLSEYRKKRDGYIAGLEKEKEDNYKAKLKIIEDLKELVNSNETLNHTFNSFRELQNSWREIGPVPQQYVKDLWDTYHHHVENFYNFIKINNELRDLDLKKNMEGKIRLCEEAEKLILDPSAVSAFHKLQKLHDDWREIGPVAKEYKEQLWERFREASSKINKRHQEYFEGIKSEQETNLKLKEGLCEQAEVLASAGEHTDRKEWDKASEELIEIQRVWKTIGFAPKKDNTAIYERFRAANDAFFEKKRVFYAKFKEEMDTNMKAKTEICEIAERLQDSTDWKKTTDELIALQKQWKEVGAVPRKYSDALWKRFRAACDCFFEKKSQHFADIDSKYDDNLVKKRELLEEIKAFEVTDSEAAFETLKDYQRKWTEIGFVPIKEKDKLQAEYREIIDAHFAKLKGGMKDRKMDRFREKIGGMRGGKGVRNERERLYGRVKQLEADIALLENNIGFFAK